ncbi:transcriptional regulator [Burkholderia phage vB_BglM_WTB]
MQFLTQRRETPVSYVSWYEANKSPWFGPHDLPPVISGVYQTSQTVEQYVYIPSLSKAIPRFVSMIVRGWSWYNAVEDVWYEQRPSFHEAALPSVAARKCVRNRSWRGLTKAEFDRAQGIRRGTYVDSFVPPTSS